jgi:hypothetical protein
MKKKPVAPTPANELPPPRPNIDINSPPSALLTERYIELLKQNPQSVADLWKWCQTAIDIITKRDRDIQVCYYFAVWRKAHRLSAHFGAPRVTRELTPPAPDIFSEIAALCTVGQFRLVDHLATLVAWCERRMAAPKGRVKPKKKIPPERRTRPLTMSEAARLMGYTENRAGARLRTTKQAVKCLRAAINYGAIACEKLNRQQYIFDINDFPEAVHAQLTPTGPRSP